MRLEQLNGGRELQDVMNQMMQSAYPRLCCQVDCRLNITQTRMSEIVCETLGVSHEEVMHAPSVGAPKVMVATARYIITKILIDWYGATPKTAAAFLHLDLNSIYHHIRKTHNFLTHGDEIMTTSYTRVINALIYES